MAVDVEPVLAACSASTIATVCVLNVEPVRAACSASTLATVCVLNVEPVRAEREHLDISCANRAE